MTTPKQLFGRTFINGAFDDDVLLTIDGGIIVDLGQTTTPPASAHRVDGVMVPGFVDVHVHGGDGADFMDASIEANERILRFHARSGTTSLAATTLSATRDPLRTAVAGIVDTARRDAGGAQICGIHLEGPYISRARAGAQDRDAIRTADPEEIETLLSLAPQLRWIATVAPEAEGVVPLVERFKDRILFSIGHTSGTYADAASLLDRGAGHFTHLFNAMTPLQHREPGVVGAALGSLNATAELIADGVHVHPAILRIATQLLPDRIALVTDAMRACGLADGTYSLLNYEVVVAEGAARLRDGTLAGSVLTMDRAVRNMVELAGLPIEAALPLASSVPARILRIEAKKGSIASGCDADIVVLDDRLEVTRVFARGEELA